MSRNFIPPVLALSILLFSCNNSAVTTENNHKDSTTPAANPSGKKESTETNNSGAVSFIINGTPAVTNASDNDNGKHAATFFGKNKTLDIYLLGYIAPDTYRHQLQLSIKNFAPGTTGSIATATAQFSRKDDKKNEFIYGNRKEGSFKLTITKWENITEGPLVKAVIAGTFEGDMECETCFDPAVKNTPFAQTQHITSGKFENIKVSFLQ